MKTKQAILAFSAAMALATSTAASANYTCEGPVVGLALGPTGIVTVQSIAGIQWPYLCQLRADVQFNTPPDTCKAIYSLLLAAQTSGKNVRLWFDDNLTCSTHPSWANLTGWYFGPELLE